MVLLQIESNGVHLGMFGINLMPEDAAWIILLVTNLLLIQQYGKSFPSDAVPCLVLMALLAISFSRGLTIYTHQAAENGIRYQLVFATPALAIMLARPTFRLETIRLARWFSWAGLCLGIIALFRWAGVLPIPAELETSIRKIVRVLPADCALIVGQAFIAAIYLWLVERRNVKWWASAGVFGVLTFALQHRSVWVAIVGGLAWFTFRTSRLLAARWLGIAAVAGIVLCLGIIAAPKDLLESTRKIATVNVQEVQSKNSTWSWRVEGYEEATARLLASNPIDILVGPPSGWQENTTVGFASTHIHSEYVETLAFSGIVGVIFLLLWFAMLARRVSWPIRSLYGRTESNYAGAAFLEALLISELLYLIPYPGGVLQGATLGLIWVAAKQNGASAADLRIRPIQYEFEQISESVPLPR